MLSSQERNNKNADSLDVRAFLLLLKQNKGVFSKTKRAHRLLNYFLDFTKLPSGWDGFFFWQFIEISQKLKI